MSMSATGDTKEPRKKRSPRRMIIEIAAMALIVAAIAVFAKMASPLQASPKPSIDIEQCANGGPTCDSSGSSRWITGNLGSNNADYREGDAVPYRMVLSKLTVGETYKVSIEWDSTESGKHAIDYLTSHDFSETTADPCAGVVCAVGSDTLPIPADPNVSGAMVTQIGGQSFGVRGGMFPVAGTTVDNTGGNLCASNQCTIAQNPGPYSLSGSYAGTSKTSIDLYVTATDPTVVLSWGGHIASRVDWGADKSAAVINGSPYHMRAVGFSCSDNANCSTGNMDLSLSSAAVMLPASITIVKQAATEGASRFSFVASPAPLGDFSLVDDGTSSNIRMFTGITAFGSYTVTEETTPGWALDRIECATAGGSAGSTSVKGSSVMVVLAEGDDVVCTFFNEVLPVPALSLNKSADSASFSAPGEEIVYTYVLTNTGESILGPDQFTIADDMINGGAAFACGPAGSTLQIGGSITCTATHGVTETDVANGSIVNVAVGSGGGVSSPPQTVAVAYVPVATTTVPPATTTVPEATTTVPPATTTVPESTTTVPPATTTVPESTTTVPPATTSSLPELQVLVPEGSNQPEDLVDVLFADELPDAGYGAGLVSLVAGILLLAGIATTSVSIARRSRDNQSGGDQ